MRQVTVNKFYKDGKIKEYEVVVRLGSKPIGEKRVDTKTELMDYLEQFDLTPKEVVLMKTHMTAED